MVKGMEIAYEKAVVESDGSQCRLRQTSPKKGREFPAHPRDSQVKTSQETTRWMD